MSTATLVPLRIWVHDVWDELVLDVPADATIAQLKREALGRMRIQRDPDGYVVKFRGAEMLDESRTVEQTSLVPNAALIILQRRRRAVR